MNRLWETWEGGAASRLRGRSGQRRSMRKRRRRPSGLFTLMRCNYTLQLTFIGWAYAARQDITNVEVAKTWTG
jgi:hypothetical protein